MFDEDGGVDREGLGPAQRQRPRGEPLRRRLLAGERLQYRRLEPLQLVLVAQRAAAAVLDEEIVERHVVGGGVDARVDDVAAGEADRAGEPTEQARLVRRVDADQGGAPALAQLHDDRADRRVRLDRGDEAGIVLERLGGLGEPVGVREADRISGEASRPASRASGRAPPGGLTDPLAPARLLVAEPQPSSAASNRVEQELSLPAVPGARPDRA